MRRVHVDKDGFLISASRGNPAGAVRLPDSDLLHLLRHVLKDSDARISGRQVLRADSEEDMRVAVDYMGGAVRHYNIHQRGAGDVYNISYPLEVSSRWGVLKAVFILRTDGIIFRPSYSSREDESGFWGRGATGWARNRHGARANVLLFFPEMGRERRPEAAAAEGIREVFQTTMMLPWARGCPWADEMLDPEIGNLPLDQFFWPTSASPDSPKWNLLINPYIYVNPLAGQYDNREEDHHKANFWNGAGPTPIENYPAFKALWESRRCPLLGEIPYPDE